MKIQIFWEKKKRGLVGRFKETFLGKPKIITDYKIGKVGVDLNDQNAHYSTVLRKNKKWFVKLA